MPIKAERPILEEIIPRVLRAAKAPIGVILPDQRVDPERVRLGARRQDRPAVTRVTGIRPEKPVGQARVPRGRTIRIEKTILRDRREAAERMRNTAAVHRGPGLHGIRKFRFLRVGAVREPPLHATSFFYPRFYSSLIL